MARTLLVAATLLLAPLAVAEPYGPGCGTEDNWNNDGNGVQCRVVTGPASLSVKPMAGAGLGVCTSPILIFPCYFDGATTLGAAYFLANDMDAGQNYEVSIWAAWVAGAFPPAAGGFEMTTCNDRDLDGICTNIPANFEDQIRSDHSNEPALGVDCGDADKDAKDCPDPTDAERVMCMLPNLQGDWAHGQIVVFVGAWASAEPGPPVTSQENVGAGISEGTYDVWMKVGESGCTPPECDDKVDQDWDGIRDTQDEGCSNADDYDEDDFGDPGASAEVWSVDVSIQNVP